MRVPWNPPNKLGTDVTRLPLAKSLFLALALCISLTCVRFYNVYTPFSDDFAWILHCDHRFANAAEWFTRGSTDYHINFPGLVNPFSMANFRPLTAIFFNIASWFYAWIGYKSQLAMNYVLLVVIIWAYLQFLQRFTPLPAAVRWIMGAAFLVSPVWSESYFYPSVRVHLLECASTLIASLLLPSVAGGSLFRRVVPSAIVSSGGVFAHELGIVTPFLVAWTHYNVSSHAGYSRKKAAGEALLIVAISLGLYFSVRLALFQPSVQGGYQAFQEMHPKSPVVAVLGVLIRLFFPFDRYVSGEALRSGGTLIGWLMVLFTLTIYVFLAAGLVRDSRYRSDLRMLTGCTVIAAAPLVFAPLARHMCNVLIYCLPAVYLAVRAFTSANVNRLWLRGAGTALLAGAGVIYVGTGIQSFVTARANCDLMSRDSASLHGVLVSAMRRGASNIFLINDVVAYAGSLAMLQLAAKENGVTLAGATVVNYLSPAEHEDGRPAQDSGTLVECRGDLVSIQIDLAPGRGFMFGADPQLLLTRANTSGGRYKFPHFQTTEYRTTLTRSGGENVDFGSRLIFDAPTGCSSVGVVGFPGRGPLEPQIFLLGAQPGPQAQN
ncbi:MAG: hypothetical protein ACHQIK_02120 [Candidatus Acidiferrales bacterium]